jgi:hypothetical protein
MTGGLECCVSREKSLYQPVLFLGPQVRHRKLHTFEKEIIK